MQARATGRALLYETEGLTAERARQMLGLEGFTTCVVDDLALFHELRAQATFDLFVLGVSGKEPIEELGLAPDLDPLVLLAPLSGPQRSAHYRMAAPGARLVDRALRDPDLLRQAIGSEGRRHWPAAAPDPVRRAFGDFGLSERQLEVLSGALRGATSGDIARELFISEPTVRNHLHAIYERVGVSGRRELLGRFVQALIESEATA